MKYTPPNTDADAERFLPLSMGKDLPLSCRFSYLLKKAGIMSTKRIFTIVMPGKIMA